MHTTSYSSIKGGTRTPSVSHTRTPQEIVGTDSTVYSLPILRNSLGGGVIMAFIPTGPTLEAMEVRISTFDKY